MCPLECIFIFSLWISFFFATSKWSNECLRSIEKESKQEEVELRREKERKETNERELQRATKEVYKTIRVIYIELLASRSPPTFHERNENFREGRDVEEEIFETLRCVAPMGGLEETLRELQRKTTLPTFAFVIISDYEEQK